AFDAKLWSKMAEQGWMGIIFSEDYGGFGLGYVEMAAVLEEMGRALLPGPYLSTLLAGSIIEYAGSEDRTKKFLTAICKGEAKSTLAFLEESVSWSPRHFGMKARRESNGYVLTGHKRFVPDAAVADFLLCAAMVAHEPAIFLVPCDAAGFNARPTPAMDGTRKLYEVMFDSISLPEDALLAKGSLAVAAIEHGFGIAKIALVAEMVGGMQRLLEITVEYAKTRKQFGRPIGQFQAVQHMCADMLLLTESSRSAAYFAAFARNEGLPEAASAVSVAKAYASDAYREVGNRAIQVHGGMGFTWENDVHLYYRRAKGSEISFGDANWHREQLAKLVIDRTEVAAAARAPLS
ncbi:MAG: acyl-CoA dehydrogenase family protein, partial [Acidobacteriaceae bacterium]|nr:acyl-CoA dehydrogenase family protein [Acidobacteriaceae bacterium]